MLYTAMEDILASMKTKLESLVKNYEEHLLTISLGNANPSMISNVLVKDVYGSDEYLKNIAKILVINSTKLQIDVFDRENVTKAFQALQKSQIGMITQNKTSIYLELPPLTLDYIKKVGKSIRENEENQKVNMRNVRRHYLKQIESLTKNEQESLSKKIQTLLDNSIDKVHLMTNNFIKKLES